jgi:hypothetical protein
MLVFVRELRGKLRGGDVARVLVAMALRSACLAKRLALQAGEGRGEAWASVHTLLGAVPARHRGLLMAEPVH